MDKTSLVFSHKKVSIVWHTLFRINSTKLSFELDGLSVGTVLTASNLIIIPRAEEVNCTVSPWCYGKLQVGQKKIKSFEKKILFEYSTYVIIHLICVF